FRYILFMVIKSGNSVTQGPHQVAHTLISRSLSELFFKRDLRPISSMLSMLTGSFDHSSLALSIQLLFSAHLMEQPNTFVVCTVTGLLASSASMAFRVSKWLGVLVGFSTS